MTTRRKNDLYPTETAVTRQLLSRFGDSIRGNVLEPCAGPGVMALALNLWQQRQIITNDIDPAHFCDFTSDATDPTADCWRGQYYNWVITNPPFSVADQILPIAFDHADHVAFLLRLTFMEPTNGRGDWLDAHKDQMVYQGVLNPRPKFRSGEINPLTGKLYGTDSVTVAWFVWKKKHSWAALGVQPPFDFVMGWQS